MKAKFIFEHLLYYRHIVGDLQQAYNTLLEISGETTKCLHVIESNPYDGVEYTVQEAEAVCIFNLAVLAEIGNTKSNLIAVSVLL